MTEANEKEYNKSKILKKDNDTELYDINVMMQNAEKGYQRHSNALDNNSNLKFLVSK